MRTVLVLLFVSLAAGAAAQGPGQTNTVLNTKYDAGVAALATGDVTEAALLLGDVVEEAPAYVGREGAAVFVLGRALLAESEDAAIAVWLAGRRSLAEAGILDLGLEAAVARRAAMVDPVAAANAYLTLLANAAPVDLDAATAADEDVVVSSTTTGAGTNSTMGSA